MHWLRLFVVLQEIHIFIYDVGCQGIEIYPCIKFVFHSVFLCQLHANTYAIKNVLAETVFCDFREIQCLHNFNYDEVRHVTGLYLSTKSHVCQYCG